METASFEGQLVCVVDDDEIYREYLVGLLQTKKFAVLGASSGTELLDVLKRQSVDCVVLDYALAAESGLSVQEQLRLQLREPPPVVMLTADESQRTAVKAFRVGVSDYVLKRGLRSDELATSICNAIARRREDEARLDDLERLRRQSGLDDMTGLFRRHAFEERLTRAHHAALRRKGGFGLVLARLNELDAIETKFGQVASDRAVRAATSRMKSVLPETAVCGRWEIDAFVCLIDSDPTRVAMERIAAEVREALSFELELNGLRCAISSRVGVALYPADASEPSGVLEIAQEAVHHAEAVLPELERPDGAQGGPGDRSDAEVAPAFVLRQGDRRKERRQRVFKRGQIILNDLRSVIDCTIRDLATEGARLRVDGHFAAPDEFDLQIVGSGSLRRVRRRWQSGKDIGVQFIG
ncbi:MAG: response regulator [Alphaproteobacteria bacterium]|nr:response regulator [Alphaproteobacteria bacterium]